MAESLRCRNCGGYEDRSIDPTGCTCPGDFRAPWAAPVTPARDTSLDCREMPAYNPSASEDCGELEIPGDLMTRLNAEFDAIARRRAELATIRVSVNIEGYSALKNGGRSIEGWNGGRNV